MRFYQLPILFLFVLLSSCGTQDVEPKAEGDPIPFTPYTIEDPSRTITAKNGVSIYKVLDGPGDFPKSGANIMIHYQGMLEDGSIFDSSYERGAPLRFQLGDRQLIKGLEFAVSELRLGSRAIVTIPPAQGYMNKENIPGVPPNSTLTFHLEVVGNH